jgi:hypothetical protein
MYNLFCGVQGDSNLLVGWENHLTISNEPYIHGDDEPTDF